MPYRVGTPGSPCAIERLIDDPRAAAELGFDRIELRRRISQHARHVTATRWGGEMLYDSGELRGNMDRAMKLADWDGLRGAARGRRGARKAPRARSRELRGVLDRPTRKERAEISVLRTDACTW